MIRKDIAILLSALGVLVVTYNLWPRLWAGSFYHGIAIGFFLLFSFVVISSKREDWTRFIGEVGLWLSFNNILDEMFFDPKSFALNEYIVTIIIIYLTYRKWRINKTKRRRS